MKYASRLWKNNIERQANRGDDELGCCWIGANVRGLDEEFTGVT